MLWVAMALAAVRVCLSRRTDYYPDIAGEMMVGKVKRMPQGDAVWTGDRSTRGYTSKWSVQWQS